MKPKSSPTYLQIEQRLTSHLRGMNFSYGDKLPTEYELMEMFQVSRTTIRKTLQILEAKSLISRNRGSGTFYTGKSQYDGKPEGRTNRKKTLGLVNYFFMDYIYTEIIRGIEDEADKHGYSVIIANSNRKQDKQFEAIEWLIEQNVDGLIIEPKRNLQLSQEEPMVNLLNRTGIPVVTTHWGLMAKSVSTVTLDDLYGGKFAARYLHGLGHKKIAYVYKTDIQAGFDRKQGFEDELALLGIPLTTGYEFPFSDLDEEDNPLQGYVQTMKIFKSCADPPTAIFYFNDNLAIQGYRALAELGLDVPGDISVLGFDDHSSAPIVSPALTTFEHPKYDLGRWVAKILIDEIEFKATALPMKLLFEPKLIERHSVGPAPQKKKKSPLLKSAQA